MADGCVHLVGVFLRLHVRGDCLVGRLFPPNLKRESLTVSDVPFDRVIWSAEQCAEYLGQEKASFLKRTQWRPGFPARLEKHKQPRWKAIEVTEWALSGNKPRRHPDEETVHA